MHEGGTSQVTGHLFGKAGRAERSWGEDIAYFYFSHFRYFLTILTCHVLFDIFQNKSLP